MRWLRRLFGRTVPANTRTVTTIATVPDRWGVQAASLGLVTHTFSPASSGRHGGGPARFGGLPGFGVHRWAGAGSDQVPVQVFTGAAQPIQTPGSQRLGAGAGVSGQPGLPSTGEQTGAAGYGYPTALGM